jgi:competence protein CoiA
MPVRCLDPAGQDIHSFDLTEEEWRALELSNRAARHLRMPCCGARVTLKRSRRGIPFFAHKSTGTCTTAPEREEHLRLKAMAVAAARANGWDAQAEVAGAAGPDEPWRADVLARKGRHSVAVEIQWSGQSDGETMRRQERYRRSGIRGLWLLRRPGFPITRELPAVIIGGDLERGFSAIVPGGHQELPMGEFLDAVFAKRFRYGVPTGVRAELTVRAAWTRCWYDRCQARTRIVTQIEITFGPNTCGFSVSELGEHPELMRAVLDRLPPAGGLGTIKHRYSGTLEGTYMSNGCAKCDRLYGQYFEIHARYDEEVLCMFPLQISEEWKNAIDAQRDGVERWSVYPPGTLMA